MESQETNRGLERNALSLFDAVMAGLAQMAPAFSILFTAPFIASIAGASVPLVFLLATIGILATGNALAQFSRYNESLFVVANRLPWLAGIVPVVP